MWMKGDSNRRFRLIFKIWIDSYGRKMICLKTVRRNLFNKEASKKQASKKKNLGTKDLCEATCQINTISENLHPTSLLLYN